MRKTLLLLLMLTVVTVDTARAEEAARVNVAVASNALAAIQFLVKRFSDQTGYQVTVSSGSTGKLYAQISNGAPYDIFLAANEREPMRLEQAGYVVMGSRFTYALGRLALCISASSVLIPEDTDFGLEVLSRPDYQRLAIANPRVAPYGLAAQQMLIKLGVWEKVQGKLIRGENINQAFQYVDSGNADLGIVALSQVKQRSSKNMKCMPVAQAMHEPIKQQAVMLKRAEQNRAARELLDFLQGEQAGRVLQDQFGYGRVETGKP